MCNVLEIKCWITQKDYNEASRFYSLSFLTTQQVGVSPVGLLGAGLAEAQN